MQTVTIVGLVASFIATVSAVGDEVWRQGSVLSFRETVEVRTALTIESGVTATFSNGASLLILPGATLTVNGTEEMPVRLEPADETAEWNGVRFVGGAGGVVRHLDVRGSRSTSVAINGSSPVFEYCRFGNSTDDGSLGLVLFAAVLVTDEGANPTFRRCIIESVRGLDRLDALDGVAGTDGADGANGTVFSKDGKKGVDGTAGGNGANGLASNTVFGIAVLDGAKATIESNIIRGIVGGRGGRGGDGGEGGDGGDGGDGVDGIIPGVGGDGGAGGAAGAGGNGGAGGSAFGIFVDEAGDGVVVLGNAIYGIQAGEGGAGGLGGKGGLGGAGGAGGDCSFACSDASDGGDGGAGAPGGAGGKAGAAGGARGVGFQFPVEPYVAAVTNNSLALIVPAAEATPGAGGAGGLGGAGGVGGSGGLSLPDGEDGVAGGSGAAGSNGAATPVAPAIGVSASGAGAHVETSNHASGIIAGVAAPVVQFRAINGATMQVSTSCVDGHTTLVLGDVTIDASTIEANPLYVAPPSSFPFVTVSLALQAESPAIDLGSNAEVPVLLSTDLAGLPRIVDGNGDGSAIVDAGAYESAAVTCGPDLNCDGAVGGADLAQVLGNWGPCAAPCAADLDGSGTVDGADLAIVLANWS